MILVGELKGDFVLLLFPSIAFEKMIDQEKEMSLIDNRIQEISENSALSMKMNAKYVKQRTCISYKSRFTRAVKQIHSNNK